MHFNKLRGGPEEGVQIFPDVGYLFSLGTANYHLTFTVGSVHKRQYHVIRY